MLPLSDLSLTLGLRLRSGAATIRGLVCDVDDTLTHKGVLVPAAYQALCRVRQRGWKVIITTGRPLGWGEVYAAMWPVDAVVVENGALAVRSVDRKLEHLVWQPDGAEPDRQALIERVRAAVPRAALAQDQWLRRRDIAFDIAESQFPPLDETEIARIADVVEAAGAHFTRSTVHAHIRLKDWDKAQMCVTLARQWWREDLEQAREEYFFVGDSPNDQAAFAFFPHCAGVANVGTYAHLLAPPPKWVAQAEGGHGFAEIVDELLKAAH